jgi:hypothetical protein
MKIRRETPMRLFFVIVSVLVPTLAVSGLVVGQTNPIAGTWKRDLAKSKYTGAPAKSQTRTYQAQADGFWKISVESIGIDEKHVAYSYVVKFDGKDYPVNEGTADGPDTINIKRVDSNSVSSSFKKAGRVVETTQAVVSEGGKVLTIMSKGTNASGQSFDNRMVFDKQ